MSVTCRGDKQPEAKLPELPPLLLPQPQLLSILESKVGYICLALSRCCFPAATYEKKKDGDAQQLLFAEVGSSDTAFWKLHAAPSPCFRCASVACAAATSSLDSNPVCKTVLPLNWNSIGVVFSVCLSHQHSVVFADVRIR